MKRMSLYAIIFMSVALFSAARIAVTQEGADPSASDAAATTPQSLSAELKICASVAEREPVGAASEFPTSVGKVYCWSRVNGADGETAVKHVWSHNGMEMASVELAVRSSSWRTWSSKTILPGWDGAWEVRALDAAGATIGSASFTIVAGMPSSDGNSGATPPDSAQNK